MEFDLEKIKTGIKNSFDKTTDFTVKYAGKAFSFTKLKVKASETKNKISDVFKEMGQLVYGGVKEEKDVSEELNALIEKTDELKAILNDYNEKLNKLK